MFDDPVLARDVLALYAQAIASAEALACDALLLRVLARAAGGRRAAAAPSAPSAIRHARARIDDDPAASLSLADLAAACGLSRTRRCVPLPATPA